MSELVNFVLRSVLVVLALAGVVMAVFGGVRATAWGYDAWKDRDAPLTLGSWAVLMICLLGVAFFSLGVYAAFTAPV